MRGKREVINIKHVREKATAKKSRPKTVSEWLDSVEPDIEDMECLDAANVGMLSTEKRERLTKVAMLALGQIASYGDVRALRLRTREHLSPQHQATADRLIRLDGAAMHFFRLTSREFNPSTDNPLPGMNPRGGQTGSARRRFRKAYQRWRRSTGINSGKELLKLTVRQGLKLTIMAARDAGGPA
jgi:hypothetical protein